MATPASNPQVIRFGAYEVDPRTGEMRKHGLRIRLQDQPFAILLMLLERPGELVTREEIRNRLWPSDTFVDFDHSLNTAIRRLRDALCDGADNPRFIETLPRRGYRFIGNIGLAGSNSSEVPPANAAAPLQPQVMPRSGAPRRSRFVWVGAACVALLVAAVGWILWPRPAIDSIAVLPFVNASNDADLDYLSDGIAESVMANLSQVPTLKVMSRNSVFRYKGRSPDPKQAARELGVRAVLLGTMRQQGNQLRISLELVDAHDGRQLWGADFERARAEAVQIEREISQQTSEKLRLRLTGEQQDRLARQHLPSPEAYDLYLRGHQALQNRTNAEIRRGLEFLQRAVDADPAYAEAHAELAAAYGLQSFYGGMEPKQAFLREDAAARRAVELAPDSARVHVEMAYLLENAHRDFAGAEREWKRAIELEPNYGDAHHGYSLFLANRSRFAEALQEASLYEHLDPLWRGGQGTTALILFYSRRYAEAERYAVNIKTAYFSPVNIAAVYIALGDQSSALKWLRIADEQRDPWLDRLEVEPRFDPLRKLPEFKAIMQKAMTRD